MTLINECFVTYNSLLQINDFLSLKSNLSQKWLDKLELNVREAFYGKTKKWCFNLALNSIVTKSNMNTQKNILKTKKGSLS